MISDEKKGQRIESKTRSYTRGFGKEVWVEMRNHTLDLGRKINFLSETGKCSHQGPKHNNKRVVRFPYGDSAKWLTRAFPLNNDGPATRTFKSME